MPHSAATIATMPTTRLPDRGLSPLIGGPDPSRRFHRLRHNTGPYRDLSGAGGPCAVIWRPRHEEIALTLRRRPFGAALTLAAAVIANALAAGAALAQDDGRDVPRMVSLGGLCIRCDLTTRHLAGAHFMGGDFQDSLIVGSNLRGASFMGSNFSGADFSHSDLRGAMTAGALFQRSIFVGATMTGLHSLGSNFDDADLQNARIDDASLEGTKFRRANGRGAHFDRSRMLGAILDEGDFNGASFRGADLTGASLAGGHFDKADFKDATLRGTRLSGADLSGARNLTRDQLGETCADHGTHLPAGIQIRLCGPPYVIVRRAP